MGSSLSQRLPVFAATAGMAASLFVMPPLPNASSPVPSTSIIVTNTNSQNYYQQFFFKNYREQALSIFGPVRYFNEREKMLYREMLKKTFKPTGKNVMKFYK